MLSDFEINIAKISGKINGLSNRGVDLIEFEKEFADGWRSVYIDGYIGGLKEAENIIIETYNEDKREAKDIKLEPCPFCGGDAYCEESVIGFGVRCKKCGARVGDFNDDDDVKSTILKWNRRIAN